MRHPDAAAGQHIRALLATLLLAPPAALRASDPPAGLPAPRGEQAVFVIRDEVAVTNPPRFGVNFDPPGMSHWNTEPWHNQWWLGPNPNPITARHKGTATGGSATTLDDDKSPGIGYYDVFRDGFFDGGTAVVYRLEGGVLRVLREGRIARYLASRAGPNRVEFAEPGPEVRAGDEYLLHATRMDIPAASTRTWAGRPWWCFGGLELGGPAEKLHAQGVRVGLSADAPPGGGGASFALTLPAGWTNGRVAVGQWLLSAEQADWPRFRPGRTYSLRVWLKQNGLADGAAHVKVASLTGATFRATGEWAEYRLEFAAAPPRGPGAERLEIGIAGAGTLLIDNLTIVERDGPPPYGFYPHVIETLERFRPSTLRLWSLQENRGFGKALDDALGPPEESNLTFRELNGAHTTDPLGLHRELELCARVGADPWIITSTMFTPAEQQNLIEYLAGPPGSPHGRKRAAWGRAAPWTEAFRRIKIEMGNETWNGMFAPQHFSGRGAVYGALCELMFQRMKASPHFRAGQFQFVVNGWVAQPGNDKWGYGANALRHAPSAQAVDIAYYTGGWDAVGLMKAGSEAEGWMNALTYSRRMLLPRAREFRRTAEAIAAEQGRPGAIESLVYEAGPGYTLPGPGKFNRREQEEGKSLAHAINALDIFLSNLREGYGDQSFFTFLNGHYWSSHNRTWGEHIAWKALGLRNALLAGDLLACEAREMVTIDLPETQADLVSQRNSADRNTRSFPPVPDLPLVDCYPFRDGPRHAILLLSRRLDGPTRVTLELPYDPRPAYTLHTLAAPGPGAHNIDEEAVRVERVEKTGMERRFTLQVPPHAAVVLVNEAK
ncbi:MAG: hypothetical protein FJ221_08770 [Lentisphaerae bacterium]|nr:hypothetical protein [Lentisphaerota bacterium]